MSSPRSFLQKIQFSAPIPPVRLLAFSLVFILVLPSFLSLSNSSGIIHLLLCITAIGSATLLLFCRKQSVWFYWGVLAIGSSPALEPAETALNLALFYGGIIAYSSSSKQNLVTLILLLTFYIPRSGDGSFFDILSAVVFGLSVSFVLPVIIRTVVNHQQMQEALHQQRIEDSKLRRDQDRKELARELHDVVARELTVIALHASMARDSEDQKLRNDTFALISEQSRSALHELRRLVSLLRTDDDFLTPPQLYSANINIENVLAEIIQNCQFAGFPCETKIEGDFSSIPDSIKPTVERVLKELGINIIKHATPGTPVSLSFTVSQQYLRICSNNHAGKKTRHKNLGMGYGLEGLKERITFLGGTLQTTHRNQQWTTTVYLHFA